MARALGRHAVRR